MGDDRAADLLALGRSAVQPARYHLHCVLTDPFGVIPCPADLELLAVPGREYVGGVELGVVEARRLDGARRRRRVDRGRSRGFFRGPLRKMRNKSI